MSIRLRERICFQSPESRSTSPGVHLDFTLSAFVNSGPLLRMTRTKVAPHVRASESLSAQIARLGLRRPLSVDGW